MISTTRVSSTGNHKGLLWACEVRWLPTLLLINNKQHKLRVYNSSNAERGLAVWGSNDWKRSKHSSQHSYRKSQSDCRRVTSGRCRGSADLAGFIPKSYGVRGKLLRKYIYRGMVPSVQLVTMKIVILQATCCTENFFPLLITVVMSGIAWDSQYIGCWIVHYIHSKYVIPLYLILLLCLGCSCKSQELRKSRQLEHWKTVNSVVTALLRNYITLFGVVRQLQLIDEYTK